MGNIDTKMSPEITIGLTITAGIWAKHIDNIHKISRDNTAETLDNLINYFHQSYSRLLKYAQDVNPPEKSGGISI